MSRPIRIQHVLLSLDPGGLENGVVNVVNRLPPTQFTSAICCLQHGGAFAARVRPGVPITEMGLTSGNDLILPLRLARHFRRTRPDIVHTRNAEAFFYGFLGARLAGIDCVVHSEHGRRFDDRPLRFRVQRWMSRHARAVMAVSNQLKADLVHHVGIPPAAIGVLYNGVESTAAAPDARLQARALLGIDTDALVIGSVGRMVEVKNYMLLLEAFAALGRPDACLLMIGEGSHRPALEAAAGELGIAGQVRFTGHRDDVRALLPAFDIFVLPSLSEGLSNTLLEAMAAGVACVASNVGGNPEIIRHECDGLLFASGDARALQAHLAQLGATPALRASLAQAGRVRIARTFSMEAMIDAYAALYTGALQHAVART